MLLIISFFRFKTRKRKSPLNVELLRSPGESIREQLDDISDDIITNLLFLGLFPVLVYSVVLSQYAISKKIPGLSYVVILALILIGTYIFNGRKLYKLVKQRNNLRVGYESEVAVGQGLQNLAKSGFNIFHDFPAQKNFNIDHVVVGPQGVFAIETKGRAKFSKSENENWKLEFDGQKLLFPGWVETKPVAQAIRQAQWLEKWIENSTGDRQYVTPVLAIPGWYIHQKKSSDLRLTNGKNFDFLGKSKVVLTDKQIKVISFQVEKMCRTVKSKAYKKKEQ